MGYNVERDWYIDQYHCVIVAMDVGHRCGYVGIPEGHPLYGVEYDADIPNGNALLAEIESSSLGKRGILTLVCWDGKRVTPEILFNVHGSLTFSGTGEENYPVKSNEWFFGFDCAHVDDAKDPSIMDKKYKKYYSKMGVIRTTEYVEEECRNLVAQLKRYFEKETV